MISDKKAVELTKKWIETFVIGLNLCPFARHPYRADKIRYVVYRGEDIEQLTEIFVDNLKILIETPPSVLETTVIILAEGWEDFERYLDYWEMTEVFLEELELDGVIQVASFHPDYQFEGNDTTDVENYTNRSPLPMLHLLREDSVSRAVEAFPEVGDIPEKNMETMNKLGALKARQMLDAIIES